MFHPASPDSVSFIKIQIPVEDTLHNGKVDKPVSRLVRVVKANETIQDKGKFSAHWLRRINKSKMIMKNKRKNYLNQMTWTWQQVTKIKNHKMDSQAQQCLFKLKMKEPSNTSLFNFPPSQRNL